MMGMTNMTRRDFFAGGATLMLGGWRLFAAPPGWRPPKKPKLVFGVISDTHLVSRPLAGTPARDWPHKYLVAALEHFKVQNVDAVVHCGDMAHRGRVRELEFHANAWNSVFPKGVAPDGHEVVKLFVAGNHEFRTNCAGRKLEDDGVDVNWRRIWGEPYDGVWHKVVKGYHFFGRHWRGDESRLAEMVREWRGGDSGALARPFFFVSHTVFGGETYKSLGNCDNAVGFFGHWHHSAANWREIYFVRGSSFPSIQVPTCHPQGDMRLAYGKRLLKVPIEGESAAGRGRQGYVVRVYDDMLTIERREFGNGGSLGADWVMPFGEWKMEEGRAKKPHPLSKAELKKVIGTPQFPPGAKLEVVKRCQCENVANGQSTNDSTNDKSASAGAAADKLKTGADTGNIGNAGNIQCLCVRIPLADGDPKCRVYAYDVVVVGKADAAGGVPPRLHKAVYAAGCNMGVGHEPNGGITELSIPKAELPPGGTLTIATRPLTSLGTFGRPIAASITI